MLHRYNLNNPKIELKSDLSAHNPLYIYLCPNRDYLLYTDSINELLEHKEVIKPLAVRDESISFLLQSGIVPLPYTIYQDIFSVGIGDIATVRTINSKITIDFSHNFPFKDSYRDESMDIDENKIIELLATATTSKLNCSNPTYLFHSAGKDSNMIALALAEAGVQKEITCLTHKSKGEQDESEISKNIATKLGFKHQKLYLPKKLQSKELNSIENYFENAPFPSVDNVTLAYPIYATQVNFDMSNIIDGSGNDVYMGHIPTQVEFTKQRLFSKLHHFRVFTDYLDSSNKLRNITLTRAEWAGINGFSFGDAKKIFKPTTNNYEYWREMSKQRDKWDYLEVRADIWGSFVESDRVIRKSRNLASIYHANLILPWCNQEVATYFSKLPSKVLYNKKELKNKLILRKILKDKIGLDSDKLGKMAFSFDFFSILMMMRSEVVREIIECKLWNREEIEYKVLSLIKYSNRYSKNRVLLQRLYLISAWYNKSRYIKK